MSLYPKLLELQKKIQPVEKEKVNPFFNNSKYFDVNAVVAVLRPLFNELGLVVLQPLTMIGDRRAIKTVVVDAETGEKMEDTFVLPSLEDAQKIGGSITYFRRYALVSTLLLEGEVDDDGNTASQKPTALTAMENALTAVAKYKADHSEPSPEDLKKINELFGDKNEVPFKSTTKVVGAQCSDCAIGKYVSNPKTGKVFCDKKCWLNK